MEILSFRPLCVAASRDARFVIGKFVSGEWTFASWMFFLQRQLFRTNVHFPYEPMVSCLKPPKIVLSAAAAAQAFSIPSANQQKCTVETMFDSACKLVCAIVQATAPSRKLAGDWCLDGFQKRVNGWTKSILSQCCLLWKFRSWPRALHPSLVGCPAAGGSMEYGSSS